MKPDREAMAAAVRDFLRAAGLPLDSDPNLVETPERVAEAWASEFLDGYARTPEEALGETFPGPADSSGELVVVTDLRFQSMCPHHLLPFEGRAHVAYVPRSRVVGFGRLGALVDCFAHRLILQEDLAREVASSLARVLKSPATACIIEAEQSCLRIRGDRQRDARTHSEAYEGRLREDGALRRELWTRLSALRR
ncbi:GTP cyclohydrolase I [Archangium sp. Cb G35]|uniref:GTP cyclohydrolase I n=1 Tax=Archangium sp. Cb G35 TaxID=1920190 RepID=UPI000B165FA0|nr:GTP cyclohydrolase I [Archangium sp. Cb G35]